VRTRVLTIALASVALAVGWASPAAAQSQQLWTESQGLSADQNDGVVPQVAIDEEGRAIAVWIIKDPNPAVNKERVQFAARTQGGNFVVPEPRQPGESEAAHIARVEPTFVSGQAVAACRNCAANPPRRHLRLAMNDDGDAIVVWEAADGSIRSAYKDADADGFAAEQTVVPANAQGNHPADPEVGIDGAGAATVIWRGTGSGSNSIYRSQSRPPGENATWGPLTNLINYPAGFGTNEIPNSYVERNGSLDVDEAGNQTVVFESNANDQDEFATNAETLYMVAREAGAPNWTVVHRDRFPGVEHHSTRALREGVYKLGLFTTPFNIRAITSPGNPDPFDDRLNDSLDAPTNTSGADFVYDKTTEPPGLALWSTGSRLHASYAQRLAGGPNPGADENPIAGNAGATRTRPRLATDGDGNVMAVFKELRDNKASIQVALRPAGGAPRDTKFDEPMAVRTPGGAERSGAPVALSEPCDLTGTATCDLEPDTDRTDPGPRIDMNSRGEAVAVWAQGDAPDGNLRVRASLFIPRPAPGEEPIPIPPPPPPPPKPTVPSLIELARPLGRGEATVLTLRSGAGSGATSTSEGAVKLDWDFGTPNEPAVAGDVGNDGQVERSVRLRLPERSFTARVHAHTPEGVRTFTRSFTAPELLEEGDTGEVVKALRRVKTPPVFGIGATDVLTAQNKGCAPMKMWTGEQKMEGCFKPVEGLPDIPRLEKGGVHELAKELNLEEGKRELMERATRLTDSYVAEGRALLNDEFPVIPTNAADVLNMPQAKSLISAKAELPVGSASFNPREGFNLKLDPKKAKIPLGKLPKPPPLPKLGGLQIVGDWDVDLEKREATIKASVVLPKAITKAGIRVDNQIVLRATAERIIVDEVRLGPIDADVGGLKVKGFLLHYKREPDEWLGQGQACVISGACLDMTPPAGKVLVKEGRLAFAGATLGFPLPGIPLFKGVYLERIGFGIGTDPTRMIGSARIGVLHLVALDGRLFAAFPSSATPFVLKQDEVGPDFPANLYGASFTRATIGVSGGVSITIPAIGDIKLASGYVVYEYPGYIAVGGGYDYDLLGIVQLRGGMGGELDIDRERFNLHGSIEACLIGEVCGRAVGNVSRAPGNLGGMGACISVSVFGESISAGGGVRWNNLDDPYIWPIDGCKWSPFKIDVRGARAAQAGQHVIDVKEGALSPVLKLYGEGGPPRVRVSGPGGQRLESVSDKNLDVSDGGKIRIIRFEGNQQAGPFTVVGLQNAAPGRYTVEPLPGSPTITKTARATDQPDAKVSGRVTGKGRRRVLQYEVRDRESQQVSFQEVEPGGSGSGRTIGVTSRGGKGKIRFTTAPGRSRRRIVAQFSLAGMNAERKTVASFRPPSLRLRKPRRVRVRRSGNRLIVNWRKVPGARRYEVAARLSGRRQVFGTTRRTRIVLKGVPRWLSGRVTVRAIDTMRQSAVAGRPRFRATRRRPSPFRPLLRCKVGSRTISCTGRYGSGSRCLPEQLGVTGRRIGPARLNGSFRKFFRRYNAVRHSRKATTFCVQNGGRFVVSARGGRIISVASTAPGHTTNRVGPGERRPARLPGARRIRGLLVGHRQDPGRVVYGGRGRRVRFLAVLLRRDAESPGALGRRLRAMGLAR
jgi:hypothetical protein